MLGIGQYVHLAKPFLLVFQTVGFLLGIVVNGQCHRREEAAEKAHGCSSIKSKTIQIGCYTRQLLYDLDQRLSQGFLLPPWISRVGGFICSSPLLPSLLLASQVIHFIHLSLYSNSNYSINLRSRVNDNPPQQQIANHCNSCCLF